MDKKYRDIHIVNRYGKDIYVIRQVEGDITVRENDIVIEYEGYLGITKLRTIIPLWMPESCHIVID